MIKYLKQFKTYKDFMDFKDGSDTNDFVVLENKKDNLGKVYNLVIINKGLDSSWKNIKYKVDFMFKGKKEFSRDFKNRTELEDFLVSNNIMSEKELE